jgi:cytochrome oxidase Cu insertion factor (SCO1/SenC/PrrC family)
MPGGHDAEEEQQGDERPGQRPTGRVERPPRQHEAPEGAPGVAREGPEDWQQGRAEEEQRRVEGNTAYLVDHTALAYLIDRQGRLRVVFPYGAPAEGIAADVRALLAER